MLAWPSHKFQLSYARPLWAASAHVLALIVVLAQPVSSLAWLGGAHATPQQAALHEASVEHGDYHHHGALGHHEHQPAERDDKTDVRFSRATLGPEVAYVAPYAGSFQDLLQTLLQAMLAVLPDAPSPGEEPRHASLTEAVPSQHSPSVPHRPPIFSVLNLVIP